jgi:DNA-directed RNA polymerase specialized sigma24 family protein
VEVVEPGPNPEECAISSQEWQELGRVLSKLEPSERLLLQLRFGQGVTLAKIAGFLGLPDAQTADRRLRALLDRLRKDSGDEINAENSSESP